MTKIALYSRYGKLEMSVPTERKDINAAIVEMVAGMAENTVVDVFMWNDNGQRESLLGIRASALGERYL